MEERDEQIYLQPQWKKYYYPNMGVFKEIVSEKRFNEAADAEAAEKKYAERQWKIGDITVIYIDDAIVAMHPSVRYSCRQNGYYQLEYDYSGDWYLKPLNFEQILKDKQEASRELERQIACITQHPMYNTICCGLNPIYNGPINGQSNPLT